MSLRFNFLSNEIFFAVIYGVTQSNGNCQSYASVPESKGNQIFYQLNKNFCTEITLDWTILEKKRHFTSLNLYLRVC